MVDMVAIMAVCTDGETNEQIWLKWFRHWWCWIRRQWWTIWWILWMGAYGPSVIGADGRLKNYGYSYRSPSTFWSPAVSIPTRTRMKTMYYQHFNMGRADTFISILEYLSSTILLLLQNLSDPRYIQQIGCMQHTQRWGVSPRCL